MPLGYLSPDVLSYEKIMPGANVLFSVPVNFVTPKWHFEIRFMLGSENSERSIPEQLFFADPDVRGQVETILSYGFRDLPKEHQAQVESLNQDLREKP